MGMLIIYNKGIQLGKSSLCLFMACLFMQPLAAMAGPDDPDQGMARVLNIEEPWIENAVYLSSSRDNNASRGHAWNFGNEWDAALGTDFGTEIDAPILLATQPIGRAPSVLAPISAGLKYVPIHWGDGDSENAGVIGGEIEGGWWATPQPANFPGVGSSVTEQMLVGIRHGTYWIQGQYGITQRVSADARTGWSANTAVGHRISEDWVIHLELDLNRTSVDAYGHTAAGMVLTPQVGWQINPRWQMVLGESLSRIEGVASLDSITSVLFEYSFDTDKDDPN